MCCLILIFYPLKLDPDSNEAIDLDLDLGLHTDPHYNAALRSRHYLISAPAPGIK